MCEAISVCFFTANCVVFVFVLAFTWGLYSFVVVCVVLLLVCVELCCVCECVAFVSTFSSEIVDKLCVAYHVFVVVLCSADHRNCCF